MPTTKDRIQQLENGDLTARVSAAESICQSGESSTEVVISMLRAVGDEEEVSQWAVAALENIDSPSSSLVPGLMKFLSDDDPTVVYWATTLLGRIGEEAIASEESIADLIAPTQPSSVQSRAAWALARIGFDSDRTKKNLEWAAQSPDPHLKRNAENALNKATT